MRDIMKFGLLKYTTDNIGDDIQSLAASRFIPVQDYESIYYINLEKLNNFYSPSRIKIILNGWYMYNPKEWPPNECIDPLLISMHLCQSCNIHKKILSSDGISYLKKHGPIGSRDKGTLSILKEAGIDTYFSGCLTLTLPKFIDVEKKDFILLVDAGERVLEVLKTKTKRNFFNLTPCFTFIKTLTTKERFIFAEYILRLYQSAACVITSRLHAAMPCLALETPVLLLNKAKDQYRFEGLKELVRNSTEKEYINNYNLFDVNNPPGNFDYYLSYRKTLIHSCEKFMCAPAKKHIDINLRNNNNVTNESVMEIISSKKINNIFTLIAKRKIVEIMTKIKWRFI